MEDFDWVGALSSCALSTVFEKLKTQVAADVERRREQLKASGANYTFQFSPDGTNFMVDTLGNKISGRAIKFKLTDTSIVVYDFQDKLLFEATLTLSDEGECRLLIDKQEKDLWQFRKRALETLFFRSPYQR
jgi:hypothetical protein